MKQFDSDIYHSLDGWTKVPDLETGLLDLAKYDHPERPNTNIYKNPDLKMLFISHLIVLMIPFVPKVNYQPFRSKVQLTL